MLPVGINLYSHIYDFSVVQDGLLVLRRGPDCTQAIKISKDISEILDMIDVCKDKIIVTTKHKNRDEVFIDIINVRRVD